MFFEDSDHVKNDGRQGLPLQGLTEEESDFYQILKLRGEDDLEIKKTGPKP